MKLFALLQVVIFVVAVNAYPDTTRVLFIGNSYTFVNDLPAVFKNLSASGGRTVATEMSAPGGFCFENHFSYAETLGKIRQGIWNYVVLQEQSQMPVIPFYRFNSTYPFALRLDSLIKSFGQITVFFLTWGREQGGQQCINAYCSPVFINYFHMQDSLTSSYKLISDSVNAPLVPAGESWRIARTLNPAIDLWDYDGSHPSLKGTYLTACIFYKKLFNQSPVGLTYFAGLNPDDAVFLQNCANMTSTSVENKITEYYGDISLNLFPNPVNSIAVLKFNLNVKKHCSIFLYDLSGRLMKKIAVKFFGEGENTELINLNYLSSGIYFVKFTAGETNIVRKLALIK